MERIGIIGLGRMGAAMAERLAGQGASVTGWTRSGIAPDKATSLRITAAETLAGLVATSDTIITSLFDTAAVAETLDALSRLELSGRLLIETSTVVPSALTDRLSALQDRGARAVDAPISGGPDMVRAGTCGAFVGGEADDVARAGGTLSLLTGRHTHVGPLGTGMVMKTINNAVSQSYLVGVVEQMRLAKRAGLPLDRALQILCGGPMGAPFLRDRLPKILGEDDSVGFTLSGILKDVRVFQQVAAEHGLDTPSLSLAEGLVRDCVDSGLADTDFASLIAHAYRTA